MATPYYPGCPTGDIPFYYCDPCRFKEKARIRSVFLVTAQYKPLFDVNPESTIVWQTGIAGENIIVIPETTGTLEVPDPLTGPGYGDLVETILGSDFTLTWRDPNYIPNCNFYNTIPTKSFYVGYRTGSTCAISTELATISASASITENIEDDVVWTGRAVWRSLIQPCPFKTPEGIFVCFNLQD